MGFVKNDGVIFIETVFITYKTPSVIDIKEMFGLFETKTISNNMAIKEKTFMIFFGAYIGNFFAKNIPQIKDK